jgi:hypothetical protein
MNAIRPIFWAYLGQKCGHLAKQASIERMLRARAKWLFAKGGAKITVPVKVADREMTLHTNVGARG